MAGDGELADNEIPTIFWESVFRRVVRDAYIA
jgi:hypothetical protein